MKNSIALTLLVVVLAYNVNCDRVPPARPPVNNPGVIIPTRTTKGPTRQTMPIGSRTPPQRTTVRGNVPVTTRVPPNGSSRTPPTTNGSSRTPPTVRTPPTTSGLVRTPPTTSGPIRTPPTTSGPVRTPPTTTGQNIGMTSTTSAPLGPPSPQPPQPPIVLPLIPTAPIDIGIPPVIVVPSTLPSISTMSPMTTLPPRVGPSHQDPRCPQGSGLKNPTQLPHHSDCNRFYKCDHGMAFEYRCPAGQHWNTVRNWCDFPNLAGCSANGNVQRPIDNGPITIPMAPPVSSLDGFPDPRCPHAPTQISPLGEKNLGHPGNCNKYLKCVQGLAYEQTCPVGQHWNTARDFCDMPQAANCQLGRM